MKGAVSNDRTIIARSMADEEPFGIILARTENLPSLIASLSLMKKFNVTMLRGIDNKMP